MSSKTRKLIRWALIIVASLILFLYVLPILIIATLLLIYRVWWAILIIGLVVLILYIRL